MLNRYGKIGICLVCLVMASGLALFQGISSVRAEDVSETAILDALKSKVSRGISSDPAQNKEDEARSKDDQVMVEILRKVDRSLTDRLRDKYAKVIESKPKIDLQINFDFNSADINSASIPQVMKLGGVLSSTELRGEVFLIAGHTDAKGSDVYNQRLSERRAEAIKRFLVKRFNLSEKDLVTAGYGKEQPLNKEDPFADENRRVQVVNLSGRETAEK
jgi:outer membrane protein OmpA-like peptidoglycan-associated protein